MPLHFLSLNWTWETDNNATKLLGTAVVQHILAKVMPDLLDKKLEANLEKLKKNQASLAGWITIVKHQLKLHFYSPCVET
jgi:hypothetical protein